MKTLKILLVAVMMTVGLALLSQAEPRKMPEASPLPLVVFVPHVESNRLAIKIQLSPDSSDEAAIGLFAALIERRFRPERSGDESTGYLGTCPITIGSDGILSIACWSLAGERFVMEAKPLATRTFTVEHTIEILGRFLELHQERLKRHRITAKTT